MTWDLVVPDGDEDYRLAEATMDRANIRPLPAVSEERPRSMLSARDLMQTRLEDQGAAVDCFRAFPYQVLPDAGERGSRG